MFAKNQLNVLILVLILITHFACTTKEESHYETPADTIPSVVVSAGTEINHQICGTGEPTLLFIHGWCIDQSYWSYQSDGFCGQYQVVTIDLPGYGQSGRNRDNWSIEQFGEDVDHLINQLQLKNVVLIGHSMGGDIILETALKNDKVIALVGVDNFKDVEMEFNQQIQEEINGFLQILEENYSEVASAYAEGALFHPKTDPMVMQRVVDNIQGADSTIAVASLKQLFEYTQQEAQKLSKLKQKLFLINSSYTPTDTAALKRTGVDYQLLQIHETGHYPMIEKPGEFNQLLKQVLAEIDFSA